METVSGTWFSQASTLGIVGLVLALICLTLATIFLVKQYKGNPKAAKMTRIFIILGVVFLLVARCAPQENAVLSHANEDSIVKAERSIEQGLVQDMHKLEHDVDAAMGEDNQEIQSLEDEFKSEMDTGEGKIDAGLHGGLEHETDIAINEVVDYVDIPSKNAGLDKANSASKSVAQEAEPFTAHGIEQEALTAMREHALKVAQGIDGVHSASWNKSMLPDLELDVVANVNPETAIPLMNTLCTSLSDNTVQPATVSVTDLEGGQVARQMCGALTQGVD